MKKLSLVRHAKSSWDFPQLSDFDRPLNKRGKADAPRIATQLKSKACLPDVFLVSSAQRTRETAALFNEVFGLPQDCFVFTEQLYHASPSTILSVLRKVDASFASVFLFCHNPGITNLVNMFSGIEIDNVPTCGVLEVHFDVNSWEELDISKGEIQQFIYPKLYK